MGSVVLPAAIGAGASLIGGVQQLLGQESQAKQQMQFQERMADTQYQRAVADMEKAGLNPALAYPMGGNAAPSGAQATIPNVTGQAVSSATGAMSMMKEMNLLDAQIAKAKSDAKSADLDATLKESTLPWNVRSVAADVTGRESVLPLLYPEKWSSMMDKAYSLQKDAVWSDFYGWLRNNSRMPAPTMLPTPGKR